MQWEFTHDNVKGHVVEDGTYVLWGGMGFQIEAASYELRSSIEKQRPKPMMQAYLIDPDTMSVEPVDYDGDWQSISALLGCDRFDLMTTPEGMSIYVDDEGLFTGHMFFLWKGCVPIRGKGLVLGPVDDEGETLECPMTEQDIRDRVYFPSHLEVLSYVQSLNL